VWWFPSTLESMFDLAEGLAFYIVFLFSTTLHEAAHAWAAMRGGDLTAYHGGQVSLDPTPHVRREPFGMVILPLISVVVMGWPFGYASAPYDVRWAMRYPRRAGWMALAGPASNLLLVVLAGVLVNVGMMAGVFHPPGSVGFGSITAAASGSSWEPVATALGIVFSLNLLLFVFNMFPLPPLDGSGALPLLLPKDLVPRYQEMIWSHPQLAWIGMLIAWRLFDDIFDPVFLLAVNLVYPGMGYG